MNKTLSLLLGVLVIILVGAGCQITLPNSQDVPAGPLTTQQLPDFSLEDFQGKRVTRGDLLGKPLVINSWAAWCPFCKKELEDFVTVQKDLGDAVTIVAIDRAESLKTAKGFTDSLGISDDLVYLLDPNDSFYQHIGGFSMPETIFVDSEGNIVQHKRGPMTVEEIKKRIESIL